MPVSGKPVNLRICDETSERALLRPMLPPPPVGTRLLADQAALDTFIAVAIEAGSGIFRCTRMAARKLRAGQRKKIGPARVYLTASTSAPCLRRQS
jgi:hypothetical protein